MPSRAPKKSVPTTRRKSRATPRPIATSPAKPPDARSVIARVFGLLDRWLTLYEGALIAAEAVPRVGLTPKLPDPAAAKELLGVLTACMRLQAVQDSEGANTDEAQSQADFDAVERALSEAAL